MDEHVLRAMIQDMSDELEWELTRVNGQQSYADMDGLIMELLRFIYENSTDIQHYLMANWAMGLVSHLRTLFNARYGNANVPPVPTPASSPGPAASPGLALSTWPVSSAGPASSYGPPLSTWPASSPGPAPSYGPPLSTWPISSPGPAPGLAIDLVQANQIKALLDEAEELGNEAHLILMRERQRYRWSPEDYYCNIYWSGRLSGWPTLVDRMAKAPHRMLGIRDRITQLGNQVDTIKNNRSNEQVEQDLATPGLAQHLTELARDVQSVSYRMNYLAHVSEYMNRTRLHEWAVTATERASQLNAGHSPPPNQQAYVDDHNLYPNWMPSLGNCQCPPCRHRARLPPLPDEIQATWTAETGPPKALPNLSDDELTNICLSEEYRDLRREEDLIFDIKLVKTIQASVDKIVDLMATDQWEGPDWTAVRAAITELFDYCYDNCTDISRHHLGDWTMKLLGRAQQCQMDWNIFLSTQEINIRSEVERMRQIMDNNLTEDQLTAFDTFRTNQREHIELQELEDWVNAVYDHYKALWEDSQAQLPPLPAAPAYDQEYCEFLVDKLEAMLDEATQVMSETNQLYERARQWIHWNDRAYSGQIHWSGRVDVTVPAIVHDMARTPQVMLESSGRLTQLGEHIATVRTWRSDAELEQMKPGLVAMLDACALNIANRSHRYSFMARMMEYRNRTRLAYWLMWAKGPARSYARSRGQVPDNAELNHTNYPMYVMSIMRPIVSIDCHCPPCRQQYGLDPLPDEVPAAWPIDEGPPRILAQINNEDLLDECSDAQYEEVRNELHLDLTRRENIGL